MKKIFLYFLTSFIIMVILSLLMFTYNEEKSINPLDEKLEFLNNIDKQITFFKYKYIDRYVEYKKNNPILNDIDIITRVNIGLDNSFYTNTKVSKFLNKNTILVNKYIYLPGDYIPDNLEVIDSNFSKSEKKLVKEAKDKFEEMANDAKKENLTLRVISAYRPYNYQLTLYNNYVSKDGKELADTYSARPGYSEHQTGLVIDIDNGKVDYESFEETDEFKWMQANSYKYGFILRYPKDKEDITGYKYESWHYRYVGEKIAKYIYENNITFDEYYVRFIEK